MWVRDLFLAFFKTKNGNCVYVAHFITRKLHVHPEKTYVYIWRVSQLYLERPRSPADSNPQTVEQMQNWVTKTTLTTINIIGVNSRSVPLIS